MFGCSSAGSKICVMLVVDTKSVLGILPYSQALYCVLDMQHVIMCME